VWAGAVAKHSLRPRALVAARQGQRRDAVKNQGQHRDAVATQKESDSADVKRGEVNIYGFLGAKVS